MYKNKLHEIIVSFSFGHSYKEEWVKLGYITGSFSAGLKWGGYFHVRCEWQIIKTSF